MPKMKSGKGRDKQDKQQITKPNEIFSVNNSSAYTDKSLLKNVTSSFGLRLVRLKLTFWIIKIKPF